jgi:hypothetical protein
MVVIEVIPREGVFWSQAAVSHVLLVGLLVVVLAPARTGATQSRCAASKIKATGRNARCLLGLDATLVGHEVAVATGKLQKCRDRLSVAFAKADAKGKDCLTTGRRFSGDEPMIAFKLDTFETTIVDALATGTPPPSPCQGSKIDTAGFTAACLLAVEGKALGTGSDANQSRLQRCRDKLSATFAKDEQRSTCTTHDDSADIESIVDVFVDEVNANLTAATTTTTPRTTSTTSTAATTSTTSTGVSTTTTTSTTLPPFPCPQAALVQATVTLVPAADGSTRSSFAGIKVSLGYPANVSLPGSGVLPVGDPGDPATRELLLDPALYQGVIVFNDTDTALVTTIALTSAEALSGPLAFEGVRFDCSPGDQVAPGAFGCSVTDESDQLGVVIPPEQRPACEMVVGP